MHIAWLGKKSPFCGNVTYSREITNALRDRGHQVSFLHFESVDTAADTAANNAANTAADVVSDRSLTFQEVPIPCLYKSQIYTIPSLRSVKVLTRALQQLKPDLVHASLTLSPIDFRLPQICAELGIPLVATFHPAFDTKLRNFSSGTQHLTYQVYAPGLARYDRVIVFSSLQRDLLARLGVPPAKLVIIPNGIDLDRYRPGMTTLKQRLGAKQLYVYQGRIAPEKNVEALLRAWKLSQMGPHCCLTLVGDGPLRDPLASTYAGDPAIIWHGFEPDEQHRIEILQSADVFILPSLVEGLSLSLLEAMACATACLATDAGADGEVLSQGAGITLDTQQVTDQLQTLLPMLRDHPEMAPLLGQKARQRVVERYNLTQNLTLLEALYHDLLCTSQSHWLPLRPQAQPLSLKA